MARYDTGDKVEVNKKNQKWTGTVIPSPDDSYLVLKSDNGYNFGLEKKGLKIKKIGKAKKPQHKPVKIDVTMDKNNPKVTVLSTGGTISSSVDYTTGGITSSYSAEDLISTIPELADFVQLDSKLLMNIMSEDVTVKDWKKMARGIAKEIRGGADGIVLTHGTDTLAYTAPMLSFMLQNLPVPVVLTYAQKSSDRGASDAFMNMLCSAMTAGHSDIASVITVGHATDSDDYCLVNRGTKIRKMHSSRRDSFRPINELPLAKVWPNGKIDPLNNYPKRGKRELDVTLKLEEKVGIMKFHANADPKMIDFFADNYKGLIIQGTGLGYVSQRFLKKLKKASQDMFIGMTTQEYGRVNPYVYSELRKIADSGVTYLKDMTTECAFCKLMWALGQTKSLEKTKELMLTNIAGEFSERIDQRTFLY